MEARIVDTTLRDGEQRAGIALGISEKVQIASILDDMGIYQIEAGIPAMGGEEKKSIGKLMELGLKSKISAWNRMVISDIKHSIDCTPDIIHISVPASDIQLNSKLGRDRAWVLDNLKRCVAYAMEQGFVVTVGLEDASRADYKFLTQLMAVAFLEGVTRIRYADTVGILFRQRIYNEITEIKNILKIQIEMHAHNDLGMAVSNTIAAVKAGAEFVDCTIGGIGERAGNCNYIQYITAAKACLNLYKEIDLDKTGEMQRNIIRIIHGSRR